MKEKIRRGFSSFLHLIRKTHWRLLTYHPSLPIIAAILIGTSIFLLGGGVYDLLMKPIAILPTSGRWIYFMPYYLHEQLLNESIGVMIFYTLGTVGLLLIYEITKHVRNPRQASTSMTIGIVLLIISFIAVETVLYWKLHYGS